MFTVTNYGSMERNNISIEFEYETIQTENKQNYDKLKELFEKDNKTEGVVLIGEIGGQMENEAAQWIKNNMSKPVVGFIAGQTAPPGRRMGHAGAIVSGGKDTADAKMKIMKDCGISVCESVAEIGEKMQEALNK